MKVRQELVALLSELNRVSIHAPVKVRRINDLKVTSLISFNSRTREGATFAPVFHSIVQRSRFKSRTREGATLGGATSILGGAGFNSRTREGAT